MLHMAAAAEASSEHPLAKAVLSYARSCLAVSSSSLDLNKDPLLEEPTSPCTAQFPSASKEMHEGPDNKLSSKGLTRICRVPAAAAAEEGGTELMSMAWIRRAHDAESLAGRGVKCWVEPQTPGPPGGERAPGGQQGRETVRVLVGNRALMAEEEVPISRCVVCQVAYPCYKG